MDKTAIKNFAVRARKDLIKQVKQKAFEIGIEKDKIIEPQVEGVDSVKIYNRYLNKDEIRQRDRLVNEIELKDYEQVMEEVAYTWFNRFVALRFMEVNGYLPSGVRALSSETENKIEPDIITEALNIDLDIDHETVYKYQDDNDTDSLYKYLLVKQCNALSDIMPFIFEKIADYTEILLPNNLLSEGSVIRDIVVSIEEEDWAEVEIIGWLYQYYISEKKDEVIQAKKKYKKEEIPFATQLFTPDWIVRYMVQNSLGRYWLESHPEDEQLKEDWEFYLENPDPDPDMQEKLEPYLDKDMRIENVTVFDPACGSGHILVYVFDLLFQIYKKSGYLEDEIPRLIIENNLYGLDIDDRAYQLACLSVVMKGAQYNKRFLKDIKENGLKINIAAIQETNNFTDQDIAFIAGEKPGEVFNKVKLFIDQFENAKTFGSLIKVEDYDEELMAKLCEDIKKRPADNLFSDNDRNMIAYIFPQLVKQAGIMKKTYDILVTNPPYMGSRYMNNKLKKYIRKIYEQGKSDLFATFIEYSMQKVIKKGHIGLITPYVWMFLYTYEDLRKFLLKNTLISSMIQLEYNAFEPACVPVCTFTLRNQFSNISGEFIRLSNFTGHMNQPIKTRDAITNPEVNYRYSSKSKEFLKIPGSPVAYWTSRKLRDVFINEKSLVEYIDVTGSQNITANNKKYLRYIWEVSKNKLNNKWVLYVKGGSYRKWYGNTDFVINWSKEALQYYKNNKTSNLLGKKYWFRDGITYNGISSKGFSARVTENSIYDKKGPTFHIIDQEIKNYILGFLNSNICNYIMDFLNPTLSYQMRDVNNLPIIITEKQIVFDEVNFKTKENIKISKTDWDSFETSWDFKKHPILTYKEDAQTIEEAFNNWSDFAEEQFYQLKENEEELNRIFIEIYGLEDELTPDVEEKDITVRKADQERDIKSFISYAVGCMLGRYSLDEEGLVFAGGEFDDSKYQSFEVDSNGIIPILDDEYFDDDIVARFIEFLRVTFGEEKLEENIEYIAETLGRRARETAREAIRRYFVNDFYKDHVQTYNKRPIYWLFQSDGRRKAFNALIYMHRYDSGTVSRVRTDYLHELQKKIEAEKGRLRSILDSDLSTREKNKARKKLDKLNKDTEEFIKYDEVLNHIAMQQIEIDLDDGVQENYQKFADVLARI
ncbi:BREX-1 system adenine-specific DNA-methyltransferase PglX [Natronospora cellulosivora (SeqCode)]